MDPVKPVRDLYDGPFAGTTYMAWLMGAAGAGAIVQTFAREVRRNPVGFVGADALALAQGIARLAPAGRPPKLQSNLLD